MNPWEKVLAYREAVAARRHRRPPKGPPQEIPWRDRALDERTARAIAAVINAPPARRRGPRTVAAIAVPERGAWSVLVCRLDRPDVPPAERLRTLGEAAPFLAPACRDKSPHSRWEALQTGDGPLPRPGDLPAGVQEQVRAALEGATRETAAPRGRDGGTNGRRRGGGTA